jgi:hypothetical protein
VAPDATAEPFAPAGKPSGAAGQAPSGVTRDRDADSAPRAPNLQAETRAETPPAGIGEHATRVPILGPAEAPSTGGPYAADGPYLSDRLAPVHDPDFPADEPDLPGTGDGLHPTTYAGLLFLLATAAAADVPDLVLDDPVFAARTLRWVLHGVARRLGVPTSDPAAATFAGLDPGLGPPWLGDQPATASELDAVGVVANRWSRATAAALRHADVPPDEVVAAVIRRSGLIAYAPGWVEIRMPLAEVDLDIRRAGLDLDPGWVPWLGTVVRYRYE